MRNIMSVAALVLLIAVANLSASAQDKEKSEKEKPTTTTVDAWRTAMPVGEQPQTTPTIVDPDANDPEVVETPAQIEKKVLELEKTLLEALKTRDAAMLKSLLADDFLLTGVNLAGAKSDKTGYLDWALKNLELRTYLLEKPRVRAYPTTAVVAYQYKRQASIGGAAADGDFVVTNVWVKRGNRWRIVSHHINQLPKP